MEQAGITSERVWQEFENGQQLKAGLGTRGIIEQSRMNERFFVGDQWHGVNCGSDRPLVRYNVVKRIGEYKMAMIEGGTVSVQYSAEGINSGSRHGLKRQKSTGGRDAEEELATVMQAMSAYFRATAERVKFDDIRERALRSAYIAGTGLVYTYWDEHVPTGLFADEERTVPLRGDIACEVLDVENVVFGDAECTDVQDQPYILVAEQRTLQEIRREARRYGCSEADIALLAAEGTAWGVPEGETAKATVLTRFWKQWNAEGTAYTIWAMRSCKQAVIRPAWDLGVRLYPLAKFSWERRRNCAYGESEITYLIPNQIAINRMLTANVWAVMMMGMPIMLVNSDVVEGEVTNDPGQVIAVCGPGEEAASAIRYVSPPPFTAVFGDSADSLISNTLRQAGANEVVLGDVRPENTSAIMAVREAAIIPLKQAQLRYYGFIEEIARIWAEFWVTQYGQRPLKVEDASGVWYVPFDGGAYRDVLISTRVDVGTAMIWNEEQTIQTLDTLYNRGMITTEQYISRLPKGVVPDAVRLLKEIKPNETSIPDASDAHV